MTDHEVDNTHRIVVGVDGSQGSQTALKWAMNQAVLTGATVEAITTWQNPARYAMAYSGTYTSYEGGSYSAETEKVLNEIVAEVAGHISQPVPILPQVIEGHPVEALLRAAAGADLLVVGSRGHGTFAGIVLGSVSQHCVQRAPCPVVVVP